MLSDYDVAVVGGGLVGSAIAWGLGRARQARRRARRGRHRLARLARQLRAGLGAEQGPRHAGLCRLDGAARRNAWGRLASELLKQETGLDVALPAAGRLPSRASATRARGARRAAQAPAQPAGRRRLQDRDARPRPRSQKIAARRSARRWSGGSYCPLDGHVNSLRTLPRAAHRRSRRAASTICRSQPVAAISKSGGEFRLPRRRASCAPRKVVLAAGNANMTLAPMVGLEAPMRPERGQIVVTERLAPFLQHPVVTLRQTDEGTVMIGDCKEDELDDRALTHSTSAPTDGRSRAAACSRCSRGSTSCAPGRASAS